MGFKTGKTVGDLNLSDQIKDLLDKKIMIITHPRGDGLSDGADVNPDGSISIPLISSEEPGHNGPLIIPANNIGKAIISGHSLLVMDEEGLELQVSFLRSKTVNLEKLPVGNKDVEEPDIFILMMDEALEELDEDDDMKLWICEVGIYDFEDDPRTPYRTINIAVAAEDAREAGNLAEVRAQDQIMVRGHAHFSVMGEPEKANPDEYQK